MKKENGITLIALVITIIILIILAGISIAAINNTELFNKTKQAKNEYQNSEKVEQNRLNEYVNAIDNETTTKTTVDSKTQDGKPPVETPQTGTSETPQEGTGK